MNRPYVKCDGTYPERSCWLLELCDAQVVEMLNYNSLVTDLDTGEGIEVTEVDQALRNGFINKGYVMLDRHHTALYHHDSRFWLIQFWTEEV